MLVVGTANFGQSYGIKNNRQLDIDEIKKILNYASISHLTYLDSASQYGKSESIISDFKDNQFNVTTKLVSENFLDLQEAIKKLNSSINNLKPHIVDSILLHDAESLFSKNGDLIYENLCKIKSLGLIKQIGISVYSPRQLLKIIKKYDFDVAQIPINVVDRRLLQSETIKIIKNNSIKIHARSIFLQGLLLMSYEDLPQNFNKWKEIFFQFDGWCKDNSVSKLEACIQFVKKYDFISKIVVGVDSYENLVDIDRAYNLESFNAISIPSSISSNDENLVNPTLWSRQ